MIRSRTAVPLLLFTLTASATAQTPPGKNPGRSSMETVQHLKDFQVVELRRYTTTEGGRLAFARCFEAFFPEAFEQIGSIAFGQFFERAHPSGFTWLRGFHDMDSRAALLGAFYYGPLWREHRTRMNDLLVDSDNVYLLQPLHPATAIPVLPAVDPVWEETGAQGVAVALIAAVHPGQAEAFAAKAESTFASYRKAGAREAGLLTTLDAKNNFPQLPVRSDGPYVVWLGLLPDEAALEGRFLPLAEGSLAGLTATGLLRGTPELVVLDPTPRSRLRWLPDGSGGAAQAKETP